jgi:hypothetical protein
VGWVSVNEVCNAQKYESKCHRGICGVNGDKIGMLIGYVVIEPVHHTCNLFEMRGTG